jgi:membrane protein implicated in regulation of membrane protease activity
MMSGTQRTPLALIADVFAQVSRIFRGELALAQAEAALALRMVVKGFVLVLIAVVMAITALNVLSGALVAALAHAGLGPAWAAVVVGVIFAIIAAVFAWLGLAALRPSGQAAKRAAHGLQRNLDALKEGFTA